ncbi:ABC transporter ATP-binding protein [Mesorhizobium sp. KR9-304]|uniref:ABC transporter ATP-binding protein n=1 Tax=Mesorhizobium sp. KR9-304 TaxID=3156614 RepID=UPI0032B4A407
MSALVQLRRVSKAYGVVKAVEPLDIEIQAGEFMAILGPSGCGKTTLLRMIGGFIQPSTGEIILDGVDVTRLGPERRPTNMVFQGYGLFPHMSVAQNVSYGLRLAQVSLPERKRRVEEALALVHLEDFGERRIEQLSGGQRQRVALARALVMRPKVLLLDEPLAALDLKLRRAMQEEFRRIHALIGGTFIFVTHDQEEAMSLATRICVMDRARVVQDGTPEEIYRRPATRFVSRFIGEANFFHGVAQSNVVTLRNGASFSAKVNDGEVDCVVRPEDICLPDQGGCDIRAEAIVENVTFLGHHRQYRLSSVLGDDIIVSSRDRSPDIDVGSTVTIGWRVADQRIVSQ